MRAATKRRASREPITAPATTPALDEFCEGSVGGRKGKERETKWKKMKRIEKGKKASEEKETAEKRTGIRKRENGRGGCRGIEVG